MGEFCYAFEWKYLVVESIGFWVSGCEFWVL